MIVSLNGDIHLEILSYLDIWDAVSLLLSSRSTYYEAPFWRVVLATQSQISALACPPLTDIYTIDLSHIRRIALKTARIQTNLRLPEPHRKSFQVMHFTRTGEMVLVIIPGRRLIITQDFPFNMIKLRCRSLVSRRVVCQKEMAYRPGKSLPCGGGCLSADGGQWILPFVSNSRLIVLALLLPDIDDYEKPPSFKILLRTPFSTGGGVNAFNASRDLHILCTPRTIVVCALSSPRYPGSVFPGDYGVGYALIRLENLPLDPEAKVVIHPWKVTLPRDAAISMSDTTNDDTRCHFLIHKDRLYIMVPFVVNGLTKKLRRLYQCSIAISNPPPPSESPLAFLPVALTELTTFTVLPDTKKGLLAIANLKHSDNKALLEIDVDPDSGTSRLNFKVLHQLGDLRSLHPICENAISPVGCRLLTTLGYGEMALHDIDILTGEMVEHSVGILNYQSSEDPDWIFMDHHLGIIVIDRPSGGKCDILRY